MQDTSKISIAPATISDVPTILSFIRKLAEYEKLSHEMSATESLLQENLFGHNPAAEAIIAKLAGQPVGFALFFATFSTFLAKPGIWLEDLFVLPEHRGKGVGRALLRHVAALAIDRNCGRLEWSVLDWNEPALKVYRSIGAQPMNDWTTQRLTGDALTRLAAKS